MATAIKTAAPITAYINQFEALEVLAEVSVAKSIFMLLTCYGFALPMAAAISAA